LGNINSKENILKQALHLGIGGPVGSGKTALAEKLCKSLRDKINLAVVTKTSLPKKMPNSSSAQAHLKKTASSGSKQAAVRIRRFEKTPPVTFMRLSNSRVDFQIWI